MALAFFCVRASAQVMPSFQFGLKGGLNLSKFVVGSPFDSDSQMGYYGGVWTRIGVAGIHLQPEIYLSNKNITLNNGQEQQNKIKFTSLDVPILVGTKIGAAGVGIRLNTGPVVSFILSEEQTFNDAARHVFNGNFKDQAFAWQVGAGVDVGRLGVDLRYEHGLSELNNTGYPDTKMRLFTLGLALKLF